MTQKQEVEARLLTRQCDLTMIYLESLINDLEEVSEKRTVTHAYEYVRKAYLALSMMKGVIQ